MTVKRDLKKRVRDRQARTGERYTTALLQVLGERTGTPAARPGDGAVPVVEMVDVSDVAAAVGLKGRVVMYPELAERVDPRIALPRLRQLLLATADDPRTAVFRALLITGERPPPLREGAADPSEALAFMRVLYGDQIVEPAVESGLRSSSLRFLRRAQAGVGGPSESGLLLSVPVEGRHGLEHVICMVWGLLPAGVPVFRHACVVLRSARSLLDEAAAHHSEPAKPGEEP
jgi:hypothetical protein